MIHMKKSQIGLVVGTAAMVALSSGMARAQSLRPNILIIFDTSGSMLQSQTSDGSPLCGNAGTTSRIYRLKNALRQALAQVGTDEANFGLMRFPQTETPGTAPACPRGHYNQGNGGGCRLSTDSQANNSTGAQMTYNTWFDTGASEALLVPVTKPATGLKPTAGSDFDPLGGNISSIYRWIDLTETAGAVTTITDPELRSPANSSTPLGRSLFYARMYFDNYVKAKDAMNNPLDPKAACRTNLVILVTDGGEACDTTRGSNLNVTTCASTGYATYSPEVQACNLKVTSKVLTYILTDDGITGTDRTVANGIALAGGTGSAIFVTLTDTNAVKQALIDIIAKTVPPVETCNGVDDNCNGQIDEGVSNACTPAQPNSPTDPDNLLMTAARHCAVETCNCADDNCNGIKDEGLPLNACGGACGCAVPLEMCDGLDNDCDGDIDEGFNVGASCSNNLKGACLRTGILACNAGGTGTVCDAPVITASQELCNNIDDDCDGLVDNGMLPGVGVACGNSLGTCMAGVTQCVNGRIVCSASADGGMTATTEVCNGLDDNCDGVVDNGNFTQTGQTCLCPGLSAGQVGVGTCKAGRLVCRGTRGFVCEGCVVPGAEVCDGMDNDCDGQADINPICPSGLGCKEGRCTILCIPGEFPCPSGYKCVGDYCVPQRCAGKTCPTDQRCDENTGDCVDVCAGVVCKDPKICQHGNCVDCYTLGCAAGEMCNAGRCQVDKCLNVTCGANQYCDDGKCIDLCTKNKCSGTDRCVAGQCIADNCATVGCGIGQFCDQTTGKCKNDTCQVTQCGKGERCIQETGTCAADPCNLVDCPGPCWTCAVTSDGMASCRVSGDCREVSSQIGIKGGGDGCGCAVGGDLDPTSGVSLLVAMIGLAGVFGSRRRRAARR
jgi:MYXO-CTERM domain-containing protein